MHAINYPSVVCHYFNIDLLFNMVWLIYMSVFDESITVAYRWSNNNTSTHSITALIAIVVLKLLTNF